MSHLAKRSVFLLFLLTIACEQEPKTTIPPWTPYDESGELAENATHQSKKMQYKLIQSRVLDKNKIWKTISDQIAYFTEKDYQALKPLIFEKDIPTIQTHIESGALTYETLTQWYLYRIVKYENDRGRMLNGIIAINPKAVNTARERDRNRSDNHHPIYGMPILLKDNINTTGMPTTAGAHIFRDNNTSDAFIVDRIKAKGGIILGKTNLSEWANYLCRNCPNGYSAVGGQTLNPYGRRMFDTGGSSSGSGVTIAANYAVAAVGTETSGSILSPSSSNSIVGLKPTVGLLSRSGIVPISSTLDTPGPMTRNVTDNAILLSAMSGEDPADPATTNNPQNINYWEELESIELTGLRFGVNKQFLEDPVYKQTVEKLASLGAITVAFEPKPINFENFGSFLNADMKTDLTSYIDKYTAKDFPHRSVLDVVNYNLEDPAIRIPYGQARFEGILEENISPEDLAELKAQFHKEGVDFFAKPMEEYRLDAILSINNRNAGYAAVARFPCLTLPMGYRESGQPAGLTFIGKPFTEDKLLKIGFAFEQATKVREAPKGY